LPVDALDVIFQALVLSKVTYALQAFAGHISVTDRNRLDKFFRKSHCRGLVNQVFNISSLIDRFHSQLFRSTAYADHCLHDLLRSTWKAPLLNAAQTQRSGHNYTLNHINTTHFKNTFV